MRALFHSILMLIGAPFIALAPLVALDQDGFAVVETDLAALERGDAPADQVRVTGNLYWPAAVESFSEHLRTKEQTSNGFFVPLLSDEALEGWVAAERAGWPLPFDRMRVMVAVDPALIPGEGAEEVTPAFEVVGSAKPGRAIPLHVKKGFAEIHPGLDLGRILYVEDGSEVASWQAGLALFLFGVLLFGYGFSRRRQRKAAAAEPSPEGVASPV